jgi:LacI family transcriptional regulator
MANVSGETRQHILAVAERLHYVPHSGARSLITRRTQLLGVLLPDLYGEFFSELIRGIDLAARAHGFHILVSSSHDNAGEAAAALRAMRGRVDGLLVMSPHIDAGALAANLQPSMPIVLINTPRSGAGFPSLTVDSYGGACTMVEHLLTRGHRTIALIAGPDANFDAQERVRGYVDTLARLAPGTQPQILKGDFTEASGYEAGRQLMAVRTHPDAVFAANDAMAIGCLYALVEAGLNVPGDIALAGFDDIPIARFVSPPLTTVRVRIADLGRLALEQLVRSISEPAQQDAPSVQALPTELVVRDSCGRTRASPAVWGAGPRQR